MFESCRAHPYVIALTVVVATYEWPEALDVVLRALSEQRERPFEVIVADDGSGDATAAVVARWVPRLAVRHVWQPQEGFRKARLLNRAVLSASGDYLIFLDGDCVPRTGYVSAIRRAALPRWFVATKRLHLNDTLTQQVLAGERPVWRWSALDWVVREPRALVTSPNPQVNRPGVLLPLRDRNRPWGRGATDFRPPYNGYGYTLGVWRSDLERINGFDMRLGGWDGEDVDVAHRLRAAGTRCGWPGPASSVLHLWHTYRKQPAQVPHLEAIEATNGLSQLAVELATTGHSS
jgi:glycosyltransferase involved in cell wall biosynthesis